MPLAHDSPSDDTGSLSFFRHGQREQVQQVPGLVAGKVVGDFQLVSLLGQGGMGQVWEAKQLSLNRQVAVKFVRPERVTPHQLELFAREARAGGRLSHPGIVAVYGHGQSDGLHWIAMELVPGTWTLRDYLDEVTRTNDVPGGYDRKVAAFVAEIADAIHTAHEAGVIHRDLKPQNVLITEHDRPKVTDFGLARIVDETALTRTGDFAGTYFYMSPEQVAAKRAGLDHRTDVFSLGVVLYEMLALQRPFQGDTEHQIAEQILMKEPPEPRTLRSRVPRDLAVITGKCLEKDRDKRYSTMGGLAADLGRWLANEPIAARPPTSFERAAKWCRRHPTRSVAGGLGLAAFGVIFALLVLYIDLNESLADRTLEAESNASDLFDSNARLEDLLGQRRASDSLRLAGSLLQGRLVQARDAVFATESARRGPSWLALSEFAFQRTKRSVRTRLLDVHAPTAITSSDDGALIAIGDDAGTVEVVSVNSQESICWIQLPFYPSVTSLTFSVTSTHMYAACDDGCVYVVALRDAEVVSQFDASDAPLVLVSRFGEAILTVSRDGEISVSDPTSGQSLFMVDNLGPEMTAAAATSDGHWLAVGSSTGELFLYRDGHEVVLPPRSDSVLFGGHSPAAKIEFSPHRDVLWFATSMEASLVELDDEPSVRCVFPLLSYRDSTFVSDDALHEQVVFSLERWADSDAVVLRGSGAMAHFGVFPDLFAGSLLIQSCNQQIALVSTEAELHIWDLRSPGP